MDNILPAITALDKNSIVAIDGRCGAGKTTLAATLAEILHCQVVHMDDFFLPFEMRSSERLAKAGGNVHHERFLSEVLLPLKAGKNVTFRPFDCATGTLGEPIEIQSNGLVIVEGSYCCHPNLREHYDLRIFVDIACQTQLDRISKRDPSLVETFAEKWIPLEEKYFDECAVRTCCDIIINNE